MIIKEVREVKKIESFKKHTREGGRFIGKGDLVGRGIQWEGGFSGKKDLVGRGIWWEGAFIGKEEESVGRGIHGKGDSVGREI